MLHHKWGIGLLSALSIAVGQVWAAPAESAVEVCRKLVSEAQEVDRALRTVSDRESGVAAAKALRPRLEYLRKAAEQLGSMPLRSGEEMRMLEQMMRDLTHITQGYFPVVQRLMEVNAYGADELIMLFHYYKMSAAGAAGQQPETPLARAYQEWCDAVDDMLYLLRRAQNADTAGSVLAELAESCRKAEQKAAQVESLQNGLSPQQLESERLPAGRMQTLRAELKSECSRLRDADCYGDGRLRDSLSIVERASRS